jgi:hypothetical protein
MKVMTAHLHAFTLQMPITFLNVYCNDPNLNIMLIFAIPYSKNLACITQFPVDGAYHNSTCKYQYCSKIQATKILKIQVNSKVPELTFYVVEVTTEASTISYILCSFCFTI